MTNRLKSLILLLSVSNFLFAQTNGPLPADTPSSKEKPSSEFIFKPTIGLGTGLFSFYGDLYTKHFQAPMTSRIGYDLSVSQHFTEYLQFNFYVLFGKLGANERYTDNNRNLNFESQIRVGGVNLLYDFGNFLPKDRTASPYITLGIESFEFLSKTDLYDAHGNRYYYWTDGTVRNLDEKDPNAATAVMIHRDYTYESDIRQMNLDGFGKYPERSWAIPIGAGAMFKINDYWDFKIGATMHFTFTDYIDGVSAKSVGDRVGNSKNDKFMMTSFSLHYNLGLKKNDIVPEEDNYNDVDFLALEQDDQDKDGVLDAKDSCQGTPAGVAVDAKGCPLDDDDDGVPNYKDDEINSPVGAFVDIKGVQLSDSLIAYQYNYYMDSTGAFAKVEVHDHNGNSMYNSLYQKEYSVELGTFKKGLSPELMTKFLSVNDIASDKIDDSTTIYKAGKFNSLLDAEKRRQELVTEGITNVKVVYKQNGKYYDAPAATSNTVPGNNLSSNDNDQVAKNKDLTITNNDKVTDKKDQVTNHSKEEVTNKMHQTKNNDQQTTDNTSNTKGVILRVQLGAYSRRLSKNVFKNVNDVIEIQTEDGLYKYMSGSFTSFDAAGKHKVELLLKGYQGAFITAYKDGKHVSLKEAGAVAANKNDQLEHTEKAVSGVDKKLVVFKIQLGVFKSEPPADQQAKFDKLKGIKKDMTPTGLYRYTVGSFNDYKAAEAFKDNIVKNGIEDAFIVAFFNNEYISIQEARELLK